MPDSFDAEENREQAAKHAFQAAEHFHQEPLPASSAYFHFQIEGEWYTVIIARGTRHPSEWEPEPAP